MNLTFRFESLQAFLEMDGHGVYVWTCYAVVFLTLLFIAIEPTMQRKRFIKQQQGLLRRRSQQMQSEE